MSILRHIIQVFPFSLALHCSAQTHEQRKHLNDSLLHRLRTEQPSPEQQAEWLYQMDDMLAFYTDKPEDKAYYLSLMPAALATAKANGREDQQIEFYFNRFRVLPDSVIDHSPSVTDTIIGLMRRVKQIKPNYYGYTNTMRNHYQLVHRVEKSVEIQRFEVQMAERERNPVRLAERTLMLCNSFIDFDNPSLAWAHIRRVRPIADTTTNPELKSLYLRILYQVHEAEGRLDSAEYWLRQAIQYFEKAYQKPAYTNDYQALAQTFDKAGRLDSALHYLHVLRARAEKTKHCAACSNAYTALGDFHLRHRQMDSAEVYVEKSLRISSGCEGFYHVEEAASRLLAGEYFAVARQWARAVPHLRMVQTLFDTLPVRFNLDKRLKAYQLLAGCYEKLGDPAAALSCLRQANALSDTLFRENEGKKAAQIGLAVEAERFQKEVGIAEQRGQQQRRLALGAGALMVFFFGLAAFAFRQLTQKRRLLRDLEREKAKSEALLLNILPDEIASRLKGGQRSIADYFDEASVIFIDIVGFTQMAARHSPAALVEMLNRIFTNFDALTAQHGLEKIKTIGDCYMAVAGVPHAAPDHLERTVALARAVLSEMRSVEFEGQRVSFRVGIETGPLVAGVIGEKRFIYDLWGDTVNTASRMESSGVPDAIHTTRRVYERLRDRYDFEPRGFIEIKGKGSMETFLLR